jgi:hypothetical protein
MNIRLSSRILCVAAFASLLAVSSFVRTAAQVRPGPPHEQRPTIQPVYDGWYKNADGTLSFSYGYINRSEKAIEVPIGPNNNFSPAPADRGQVTVFQAGTERNAVIVVVPGNFTQNLIWTVTANGMKASSSEKGGLNPLYIISDIPPRVIPTDAPLRPELGPARKVTFPNATRLSATVRTNTSPGAKITYAWTQRSAPGDVKFDPPDASPTSATFSARGDYVVRLTVSRPSGLDAITGCADFKIAVE